MQDIFLAASASRRSIGRTLLLIAAALGWIGLLVYKLEFLRHGGHQIDDSYMFYRYAENLRHGYGFSWNLDKVHTFGMTTLLWPWIIVFFTMLPLSAAVSLSLASWLFSGLAIYVITAAITRNAQSEAFRDRHLVMALVTLSLLLAPTFDFGSASGMETMLGCTLMAGVMGLVLEQSHRAVRPEWIGLGVVLLYLTRPEGVLAALLFVALARVLVPGVTTTAVLKALGIAIGGIALVLFCNKLYFGTALPLSFYIKSKNGYPGYMFRSYSFTRTLTFLRQSAFYLVILALLTRRSMARLVLLSAIALAAVLAYLCTVKQIMGFHERYYLPYLPLLVIPAFLALDRYFADREAAVVADPPRVLNLVALGVVAAFLAGYFPYAAQVYMERKLEPTVLQYNEVTYGAPTKVAPPIDYFQAMRVLVGDIGSQLPPGTTIAATEVGYLGAGTPNLAVIDMAGLNDEDIALHGFDVDRFLARRPDLIWMPHTDYTWQRGVLLTNPKFLEEYEYFAGVFDYGFAIRKDSPVRPMVEARLAAIWPQLYPGMQMKDALATTVTWPPGSRIPTVSPSLPGTGN